jgi:hypothetical protein
MRAAWSETTAPAIDSHKAATNTPHQTADTGREKAEAWIADDNPQIPHDSLGISTPADSSQQNTPGNSSYRWN